VLELDLEVVVVVAGGIEGDPDGVDVEDPELMLEEAGG